MTSGNKPNDGQNNSEGNVIPNLISQLSRYDDAISKEFTLVSDRMTWLVISNSFMFGSYVSAAVNYSDSKEMKCIAGTMMFLMPILGLAMACSVIPAIRAAHDAVSKLKNKRYDLEQELPENLRILNISNQDKENHMGNIPPKMVPRLLVLAWLLIFLITLIHFIPCSLDFF